MKPSLRLPYIDLHPRVVLNYFLRPVACSPRFSRVVRAVDCFAQTGKSSKHKREPSPVYSEILFSIGPDSDPVPA